jgi:hypothetical protein
MAGRDPAIIVVLLHAACAQVDVFGFRDLAAFFGKDEGEFLILGLDTMLMFEFHRVAEGHMTIAANHFDELLGHLVLPSSPPRSLADSGGGNEKGGCFRTRPSSSHIRWN